MTLFMLDTDSVSFALRGHGQVGEELARRAPSELCVSSITVAELRFGAEKRRSKKIHAALRSFFAAIRVMPFDASAADQFGEVAAALSNAGAPIGQLDTLIASHALSLGATLVSNNQRHFSKVPGLKLDNWV